MENEKRLIDANEMKNNIMEAMMRQFEKNGDQIALRLAEMMWHFIDVTDTVEAVEVVHGRWEDESDEYEKGMDLRCLVCGGRADSFVGGTEDWYCLWKPNFCPHCGAKMDGDGNG